MDSVKVTYELPADLVERANVLGIDVESAYPLIDQLEVELRWSYGKQEMHKIVNDRQSLPDEEKPTPEEIATEIRAYREEQSQKQENKSV